MRTICKLTFTKKIKKHVIYSKPGVKIVGFTAFSRLILIKVSFTYS